MKFEYLSGIIGIGVVIIQLIITIKHWNEWIGRYLK